MLDRGAALQWGEAVLVAHEIPLLAKAPWKEIEYTATVMVGTWDMAGLLEAEV